MIKRLLLAAALLGAAPAYAETRVGPYGQLAHAAKLGVPVALPTDLPPGARLVRTRIGKDAEGTSYTAFYRVGKGPVGFAIESAAGGIGDLISDRDPVAKLRPTAMKPEYDAGLYMHLSGDAKSKRSWYSEWITAKGGHHAYRLAGVWQWEPADRKAVGVSQDVDKAWAVRIGNSLAPWQAP